MGAEEGRAIKVDAGGKVVDFAVNEKCNVVSSGIISVPPDSSACTSTDIATPKLIKVTNIMASIFTIFFR